MKWIVSFTFLSLNQYCSVNFFLWIKCSELTKLNDYCVKSYDDQPLTLMTQIFSSPIF